MKRVDKRKKSATRGERADRLGHRIFGSLRVRLEEIEHFEFENLRFKGGDETFVFVDSKRSKRRTCTARVGFARVRLCFGKRFVESSLAEFNPRNGKISWDDEYLNIHVRLADLGSGSSTIRLVLLGGMSRSDLRELAYREIRFAHYAKSGVVGLKPSLRLNELLEFAHREDEMWCLARSRFSVAPFSNGKDARYESVKAELRAKFGRSRIDDSAKMRLKRLAVCRGLPPSTTVREFEGERSYCSPRCSFHLQWVPRESMGTLRGVFLEYFVASSEARDEHLLKSLETFPLRCGRNIVENATRHDEVAILTLPFRSR